MIKESEIVTKKYLSQELSSFKKELKTEILIEVRVMMHETMEGAMENMKMFYQIETKRHMTALMQGFRDEMRIFKDAMGMINDKVEDHETRLLSLEA